MPMKTFSRQVETMSLTKIWTQFTRAHQEASRSLSTTSVVMALETQVEILAVTLEECRLNMLTTLTFTTPSRLLLATMQSRLQRSHRTIS